MLTEQRCSDIFFYNVTVVTVAVIKCFSRKKCFVWELHTRHAMFCMYAHILFAYYISHYEDNKNIRRLPGWIFMQHFFTSPLILLQTPWTSIFFAIKNKTQKQREVWASFAESLARGAGMVPVAPATQKQLSEAAACLLLWCFSERPCGCWSHLFSVEANCKLNPNLGLDIHAGNSSTLPSALLFDLLCCIIFCCRRPWEAVTLWTEWGGTFCTGKGVKDAQRDDSSGHLKSIWGAFCDFYVAMRKSCNALQKKPCFLISFTFCLQNTNLKMVWNY